MIRTAGGDAWKNNRIRVRLYAIALHFSLAQETDVAMHIYDASGRLVRTLIDGRIAAGPHHATWDGSLNGGARANSGIYLCTFRVAEVSETHKMFHLR